MKLLLASEEGAAFFDLLNDLPDLEIIKAGSADEAVAKVSDVDVFYGRPTHALLATAKRLRWIQSPSAGVDYLGQLPELVESDIIVTNTRGAHGSSIAEHVFALLLAFTRILPDCWDWQHERRWGREGVYHSLHEITGSTMGIIGFGAIGRTVAKRAHGFEMNVLAVDVQPIAGGDEVAEVWPVSRLGDLLVASDSVVVAAPYTPETHHMIDAAALAKMKRSAYLIVISRGGIVDEQALADALRARRIAGAALDVMEHEPLAPDSPLWDVPNLVLTPHLAGASDAKERRCVEILRSNLIRFAQGEPLQNVVDKHRGY